MNLEELAKESVEAVNILTSSLEDAKISDLAQLLALTAYTKATAQALNPSNLDAILIHLDSMLMEFHITAREQGIE